MQYLTSRPSLDDFSLSFDPLRVFPVSHLSPTYLPPSLSRHSRMVNIKLISGVQQFLRWSQACDIVKNYDMTMEDIINNLLLTRFPGELLELAHKADEDAVL